jgi:osmotically inducible lipoprotein OsmB
LTATDIGTAFDGSNGGKDEHMNTRRIGTIGLIVAIVAGLSACGEQTGDRAVSGAGVGAGTGAVVGAIFGAGIGAIPGAIVGGAIGAGTGAATSPDQINLGRPAWRR